MGQLTQDIGSYPPFQPWLTLIVHATKQSIHYEKGFRRDEYIEAKGALLWMPLMVRVVAEAAEAGVIHANHIALFENLMAGLLAIESDGQFARTGNFGHCDLQRQLGSFRGLSQLVAEKHYLEENQYDPLTAIRSGLRNLARFVYRNGSLEVSIAEHNNGKNTPEEARTAVDAFCTVGQEFVMRVINATWWVRHLINIGDTYSAEQNWKNQYDPEGRMSDYYRFAPPWEIFNFTADDVIVNAVDLPFNWIPPSSSLASHYIYECEGEDYATKQNNLISKEIRVNIWTDSLAFEFPVSDDSSLDKSQCHRALGGEPLHLPEVKIPDWYFTSPIHSFVAPAALIPFTAEIEEHFAFGALGKTLAFDQGQHRLYLEEHDILKDRIGVDRDGVRYFATKSQPLLA